MKINSTDSIPLKSIHIPPFFFLIASPYDESERERQSIRSLYKHNRAQLSHSVKILRRAHYEIYVGSPVYMWDGERLYYIEHALRLYKRTSLLRSCVLPRFCLRSRAAHYRRLSVGESSHIAKAQPRHSLLWSFNAHFFVVVVCMLWCAAPIINVVRRRSERDGTKIRQKFYCGAV